ncbi:oxidoreductase [Fusarium proliferatum]|uniref:Oxidoreductase n=1 Tax=Gibberella intermedia TaxID=948311 RepID=A0A365MTE2_GIBIN|nr:oxidoreductase [Fusarium proliferatum]
MDRVKDVAHKVAGDRSTEESTFQFSPGYQHPTASQDKPGLERDLEPKRTKTHLPTDEGFQLYKAAGKLTGKRVLITGGDSGIGRAADAEHTCQQVEKNGGECVLWPVDLQTAGACQAVVKKAVDRFGGLDVLVNNVAYKAEQRDLLDITEEQWARTFRINIDSYFFTTQAAVASMRNGGSIINTTSVDAYEGAGKHVDYAASKGAVISLTRALSHQLVKRGIRVNAVAAGHVWTPLIASSLSEESQRTLTSTVPMGRLGQPSEIATIFVFLASSDSSYMTGQTLHPNGGIPVSS